jgi:GNAT superfamily N-acetyltransferase
MDLEIKLCKNKEEFLEAKQIVLDYVKWLNLDLSFQNFEDELKEFQKIYKSPDGGFFIAILENNLAGGVGFKRFDDEVCEIKRLFVYEKFRGKKIAKLLLKSALKEAKKSGYKFARLDTLKKMQEAKKLYQKFGFKKIDAYYFNPLLDVEYFELKL